MRPARRTLSLNVMEQRKVWRSPSTNRCQLSLSPGSHVPFVTGQNCAAGAAPVSAEGRALDVGARAAPERVSAPRLAAGRGPGRWSQRVLFQSLHRCLHRTTVSGEGPREKCTPGAHCPAPAHALSGPFTAPASLPPHTPPLRIHPLGHDMCGRRFPRLVRSKNLPIRLLCSKTALSAPPCPCRTRERKY